MLSLSGVSVKRMARDKQAAVAIGGVCVSHACECGEHGTGGAESEARRGG